MLLTRPLVLRHPTFGVGMLIAACSSASGPSEASVLRIVTVAPQYAPGAVVTLRFTNLSSDVVYYNSCNGFVDMRLGSVWATAARAAGSQACPDNLKILQAGASDTAVHLLPETLFPGVYRYRLTGVYGPDHSVLPEVERVSTTFAVVR
jgi:hypothetical protein